MKRTVLADERPAVYRDDVMSGKCLLQGQSCRVIFFSLRICGVEHGGVHDQIIGIGGGQTFAVLIEDGIGQRYRNEAEWLSRSRVEGFQFVLHLLQFLKVLVRFVRAFYIDNRIFGAEARQRVNMAVCVVTGQIAVVEPENAFYAQLVHQDAFYLRFVQLGVAVGVEQTAGGSE